MRLREGAVAGGGGGKEEAEQREKEVIQGCGWRPWRALENT
jgi:hypothetical protein